MSPPRPEPSAARPAWVGVLLVYAALAAGGPWGWPLAALGLLALARAAYSRRDGLLLLGPFARWDLVRAARRQRVHLWRLVIGLALLVFVLVGANEYRVKNLDPHNAPRLAEAVFTAIGGGLFYLIVLFAVANLPAVVAEEREANRLDHLLVTDLRDRELLLGKLVGRLAVLAGYAAVPLPVLAMLTLFGGVDPRLVLAVGVVVLGGLAGFAGVAAAASASSRKVSSAVVTTIVVSGVILYLFALAERASFPFLNMPTGVRNSLSPEALRAMTGVGDGFQFVAGGSPIAAARRLESAAFGGTLEHAVGPTLRGFLAGQLVVLATGWWWACRRLRVPLGVAAGPRRGIRGLFSLAVARPPVGDEPVYWYEATSPQSVLDRLADALYGGRWWVPAAVVGLIVGFAAVTGAGLPRDEMNFRLRSVVPAGGPVLFLVVTLPIGFVACRTLVRERERDTMDGLLLTGLGPEAIAFQKWKAAVLSPRGRYATAGVLLFWGVCAGGPVIGAIAVVATTAANAALAASLGLLCSVCSRTGYRAVVLFIGCSTGWAMVCGFLAAVGRTAGSAIFFGSLVPAAPQCAAGFLGFDTGGGGELAVLVLFGGFVSAVAASIALNVAISRFAEQVSPKREDAE